MLQPFKLDKIYKRMQLFIILFIFLGLCQYIILKTNINQFTLCTKGMYFVFHCFFSCICYLEKLQNDGFIKFEELSLFVKFRFKQNSYFPLHTGQTGYFPNLTHWSKFKVFWLVKRRACVGSQGGGRMLSVHLNTVWYLYYFILKITTHKNR